ncbi:MULTISPECIES: protoporphyrinogen oxidase [Corynebacterium]|uniref:protoporphyrinogen oxidase n=1 Tax=Corynebacterium TaxID=1716 RepID=UPI00124CA765|nr:MULTISPECIES: protoporphyrinogen oxidase [Corynebacterium]
MKYAIVGAGLAGLTAAYELNKHDSSAQIDVYEAADRIGGKLFTVPFASGPTDMGAEAFLNLRPDIKEFVAELGLSDSLRYPSGLGSLVYSGEELHPLPRGGAMGIPATAAEIRELISADTAARIDAEGNQEPIAWTVGQDLSVGELVRQRYGDDVVDHVLSSLLGGVYSCQADDLGVRATIPALAATFDAMVEAGEKVTLSGAVKKMNEQRATARAARSDAPATEPTPIFATFDGGYATFYEALAERSGARIFVDAFITGLQRCEDGLRLTGGEDEVYDKVIMATPAPTTALLLKQHNPAAAAAAKQVELAGSVVVGMKFDDATGLPDNSGILIAADEPNVHTKAFTLSSKKWPHLAARGGALVRASFGRYGDDSYLRTDEDQLVDWALDDLQAITGFDGRAAGLSEIYTQYWYGGIPRYSHTHLDTVAAVQEALAHDADVAVTGAWVGGVGVPAVVAHARSTARALLGVHERP